MGRRCLQREIVLMKRRSARWRRMRRATVEFPDLGSCLAAAWLCTCTLCVTVVIKKQKTKIATTCARLSVCLSLCLLPPHCRLMRAHTRTPTHTDTSWGVCVCVLVCACVTVEGLYREPDAMAWGRGQKLEIFRSDGISQPASSNSSRAEKPHALTFTTKRGPRHSVETPEWQSHSSL